MAKTKKKINKTKKGNKYVCDSCGMIVAVDTECDCDPCGMSCCGSDMRLLSC